MLGKLGRRSQLRAAVDSIVRSLISPILNRGDKCAPDFRVEPLEERQLLTVLTIAQENQLAGAAVSAWNVSDGGAANLNGFTTDISVNQGSTVSFKVDDKNLAAYSITIFRLGYYQGLGARQIATIASPTTTAQPAPITDSTGLIDCGNWSVSATWNVPADATSGLYIADLIRGGAPVSQMPFVVRDDTDHSKILYQTSDSTWEAYNSYGGNSLYESTTSGGLGANDDGNTPRAFAVSYNRPFINRGENAGPQEGYIFGSEYPMIRFLEQNGYDVSYATDVDTARFGSHLLDHQVVLTSGHDEYWSPEQRTNMQAARDAGVNIALFAGNAMFWKTRWAPSSDASHTNWRTIICYKETLADAKIDPTSDFTGLWRDPRFPTYFAGMPENAFGGTLSDVNGVRNDAMSVSYPDSLDRFWRNSTVASLTAGQTKTFPAGTLGYEWDEDVDNGFRPAGLIDMSHTTLDVSPKFTLNYAGDYGAGTATHSLTLYRAASGALVFSAGQTQWAWGLDTNHDRIGGAVQPAMQQATINLLADMGVQPTTLMAGLVLASASTDHTAPTSTITAPTPGATLTNGIAVTISGTAVDAGGGIVAGVEVSTDNGVTWHRATGLNNWTYTWIPRTQGNARILSRATDDSANIETPSIGSGVVVAASGLFSVFTTATTPLTPATATGTPATLGMRFVSDVSGQILGIRYYKGSTNTGTHIGSLWTNTGTLLASATFTGESTSGWQQVNFSTAVSITAGVTYVASYFAPNGHYFGDDHGLGRTIDAGPLHLLADGYNLQPDGIYSTASTNAFPTLADDDTNFFVDVVFQQPAGDTTRPTVIGQTPAAGATSAPVNNVTITFSESIEVPTLSFTLTAPGNLSVPATVTYNDTTHTATLTPTASLSPGTAYAVRVTANDLALNSLASPFTFSFTTQQNYSLWTTSTTPANTSSNGAGIEVGLRFKSDVAGYISGLMFYKGAGNTGTHVGDLWSNTGTLLASATFTGESGSGWQSVSFATPVAITPNTTYVASYFAPNGHYSFNSNYFTAALDNAPLHAPADGAGGFANGVSIATSTSGVFPTASASGRNFWVDVVMASANVDTTPPIIASTVPVSGTNNVSLTAPITVTFDDPINSGTLSFTLKGPGNVTVPATVTYNAGTNTATLTPTSFLASGTAYTASISASDASGNAMVSPYTWSFNTVTVPVVVGRTPAINGTGVAETSPITVTFNEGISTGTLVFTVTGPGNTAIPATVSFDPNTLIATLQPTSSLATSTIYTVTISASDQSGNPMPAPVTWSFTTAAVGTTFTVWPASTVPTVTAQNDSNKVEVGMRFVSDATGFITGVRFYKGTTNTGTHVGNLWSDSGTLLATATFSGETASGWQQVLFNNPIAVTAGTTYVVSYLAPVGHYALDSNYFVVNRDNSPLHGLADGTNGEANGLYLYLTAGQSSKFPTNTNASSNYWVDAVFMTVPPPNQVTGAAAIAGPNQNTLSWSAATRAVSYNIYRGTSAGGEAATPIMTGVSALTYLDTGLTPGTTYFYKITAVDAAGESARSSEVSATPIKATPVFSGISSATITYGASTTTLSGVIAAGTQIPSGTISVTINGITVNPTITPGTGAFSVAFDTHAIPASATAYVVTYNFAANANFNAASDTTHTLIVNKRTLNATATGVNRVYNGTTVATVTFSDDHINGDVISYTYSASFANKNAANGKTVSVTGILIGGSGAGNYTLASTTASTIANITKLALTVGATGTSRTYNATTADAVTLSDNRLAGDSLSLAYGSAVFADKNVGTGKSVSVSGINVTGADSGNYAWNATASTSADITPFALTVSATGVNKVYDATAAATVTLSSNRFAGDSITLSYASATYPDKNVGNGKPISVSGINVTGTDSGNYTFNTTASATANITQFALVITATAQNKTYDGTATASVTLGNNHIAGDDLTVSFTGASFANKNAGVGKTVTASGISISGADSANYSFSTTTTTTATISKLALAVTATGADKPYDGNLTDPVSLSDNRLSGDVLNLAYASATFADKNIGTAKPVSVSGINITGTDAGNYTWNTTASTTASISALALTVTATASDKVYDGTNTASITFGDNRVSGDQLTLTYGSATFSDKNVGVGKTVSVNGINVLGTDAGNYTFNTFTSTTASITKLALLVTATGQGKAYDGSTLDTVVLGDNRLSGDALTVTYASAVFADKNVGVGKPVSVSGISVTGADFGNYSWNVATSTTATITARALFVSASGQNKPYDGNAVATVTLSDNRVSGDALTVNYGSASFSDRNAGVGKTVSVSGITVSGTDAGNYTFNTTTSTTATITPLALAVTAAATSRPYDGTAIASVVLSDNRLTGDALTITYGSALFSDKNAGAGKTVTVSGISLTGTDAGNYTCNPSTTTTAAISTIALTVGAIGLNKVYDGTNVAHVTLTDNRISGDALTLTCGSVTFADKNVGAGKTISVAGIVVSGTDAANYTFNTTTSTTGSITARALTVAATGQNRPYDQSTTATVTLGDNRVAGDLLTLGYGAASFADKNAGTGKTVSVSGITVTGADSGNYAFNSTASASANITPITLAVTATGLNKTYNGTTSATATLADNRLSGDQLTLSYSSATFVDKNIGTAKPISVSGIGVTGLDSINYTFNSTALTAANITPFALTVGATGISRAYNGSAAATVTLSDNRFAGDNLLLGYSSATFTDKNVGVAKPISVAGISVAGSDAANYTFNTSASASANITAATLTITASAPNKSYDRTAAATASLGDNRIAGDVLNLGYSSASFSDKNAGVNKVVTVSGITVTGADAANYTFGTTVTTTATITPISLTVTAIGSSKVYDSTAVAPATLGDNRLFGDVLSLGYATATFSDKNVGNGKNITVAGITVTGTDALNYTFNSTASTSGNITPFALSVGAIGQNKPYDQTPAATVTLTDNRFSGDALAITYTGASFANKNVGNGKTITVTGINVVGADSGNYTFNSSTTTTANITPMALTISVSAQSKPYDGSATAAVTFGDNRLAGDVLSLGYGSATFSDKNAGTNKMVTVSGITLGGADAGNYTFNTSATTTATISKIALTVGATATSKVYDGSANASVTLNDNRLGSDVLTITFGSAIFADKNVGSSKGVTVSGINVTGTDAINYTFNTSATALANITPATLIVGATASNRAYNGTTAATGVTLSDNRVTGDALTLSFTSATFADKNVGVGKSVTVNGISVGGTDAANYTFNATATTSATITAAALNVTATGISRAYDRTGGATVTLGDNRITGDTLTVGYGSASFADKNVGVNKPISVAGITVGGADAGNYTFNATTSTTGTITPFILAVTAIGQSKVYDGTTAAVVSLGDNHLFGDTITVGYTSAVFANKNVGNGKTVTVSGITVGGPDGLNYAPNTTATASGNITQLALTVSATAPNKIYDRTTTSTATLSDNRIAGDALTLSYTAANFSDKNVGTGKTVTITGIGIAGTDAGNYTFNTSTTASANITKAALLVTATGQIKPYDRTTTATVSLGDNRLAGDVLTLAYTGASFADKNAAVGKTVSVSGINVTGADSGNYTFNTTTTTSGTITPIALTVTATGQNKPYDHTTTATVTLGDNRLAGDVLTLTYSAASFADKNVGVGKTVSVAGINVTGTDSTNYTFNTTASTTATITQIALTVSATGVTRVYDRTGAATVTLNDNHLAGDTLTLGYGSASFADKNVGVGKPVSVTGITVGGADAGNYTFNTTTSTTGTITPFILSVTAIGQSKVYDGTTAALAQLSDNHLFGDTITLNYSSAVFTNKNVGNGKTITVSGITVGGVDGANYTPNTTTTASGNISQFALTVGAIGQSKIYDRSTTGAVTLTDNRFVGDALSLTYGSATFADKNAGAGKSMTVSGIDVAGADSGNYTFNTSASATGTITQRPLNISATASNKPYDGTTAASAALGTDDHIAGDTVTVDFTSATFANKNVGSGKTVTLNGVTVGGADGANYLPTVVTAVANITPNLVVTGTNSADTLRLMLDSGGAFVDWFLNGTAAIGQLGVSDAAGLTINAGAAGMTINLDRTNGNPLPGLINLSGVFTLNGLQGTDPLAGTTLNINRSTLYVTYADAAHDPINGIRSDIHAGYNGGAWTGGSTALTGSIRSANAAADGSTTTGIGYVDSTSGIIAGQPANTIELKYTLYGDTGLAGTVGFADFTRMTQHYTQNSGLTWSRGDFDYDGSVGASDFALLSKAYNMTLPAAVPEQTPVVASEPMTGSTPVTVVDPAPSPVVTPAPETSPTPTPVTPVVVSNPVTEPMPVTVVAPAPAPVVPLVPVTSPTPVAVVIPTPAPVVTLAPVSSPTPVTNPMPVPVEAPVVTPAPVPAPVQPVVVMASPKPTPVKPVVKVSPAPAPKKLKVVKKAKAPAKKVETKKPAATVNKKGK